ncbi:MULTISPECIES: DUF6458 family protein [Streptomycetaceae]|uniref:Membrane protein n=1 Tax=Kitasatospora indigofera TaxID=67307 RepID=A0A919KZV9_9ACTN|nr:MULTISPECIES: DUF6458 family protein [Streptomycetaceae]OKI18592.1 hypothetical protein A6A07_38335 [Streptomyces sp. CB03911]GHH79660.1 membrane protein [Kitasatospora indigofera]
MGIGGCVLIFAAGAILTFGVDWHLSGVNLHVVGLVLMAAGLLGLCCYVSVLRRRRFSGGHATTVIEDGQRYDAP